MEALKKLQYAQQKLDTTTQRIKLLLARIQQVELTSELETDADGALSDVHDLLTTAEELQLLAAVSFYDRAVFQLTDDQLNQLDQFTQTNVKQIQQLEKELQIKMKQKRLDFQQAQLTLKQRSLAKQTTNQFLQDQKENMNNFNSEIGSGVRQLKTTMLDIKENLDKGQIATNVLEEKTKDNIENNKLANSKVRQAAAALKKNKDLVFMGTSLVNLIVLVLIFIFV
ncbi:Hypothetical_protein [Hexamita inflata]|uniref:Hypothetical_protein n=1 Tax=Hexamita inflata TaxID=28002 RepID=A0AA86RAV0_9EUKA|nr:Hypothetical protein HINF_LOCUS61670 [Hexamita inflata]